MTKKEKRFLKLLKTPKETSFGAIHTILNNFGYKLDRINGSHHVYEKENAEPIVIPVHKNMIKKIYVKKITKHLHGST